MSVTRHPLDPANAEPCKPHCGPQPHCHCDYHDGIHGCMWGNAEFIKRLKEAVAKVESITLRLPAPTIIFGSDKLPEGTS